MNSSSGNLIKIKNVAKYNSILLKFSQGNLDPKKLNIIAIIPSKGPLKNGKDF